MLRERIGLSLHRVSGNADLSSSVVHGAEAGKDISHTTLRRIVQGGLGMRMSTFWIEIEDAEVEAAANAKPSRKARKVAA